MLIPVGDVNPTRRTPWVTRVLLLGTIGVFLLVQPWTEGLCAQQQFFLDWAAIPAELTQGAPLSAEQVARVPPPACDLAPAPDKSLVLSVLASMVFHGDLLHLLFNMLFLWVFGNNVEDRFGHLRYLGLYVLWGVVATVAFVARHPDTLVTLVGASGAIAGVLGAYLVLHPGARVTVVVLPLFFLTVQLPALLVLGLWFVVQLREVGGAAVGGGGVAYLAHVAGFVAGAATALLARLGSRRRRQRRRRA
jgi:membrane associated rhomboid family serine protease